MSETQIGGGTKKILYTLNTLRKMGVGPSSKALTSRNTCKACAYGMGGQAGGMTNEAGEFPSICNKSVQAQSTDIQPAIPEEVFEHSLDEFRELSAHDMEQLGRLNFPIHKANGADTFSIVTWEEAMEIASEKLRQTNPDRSFFYSSGRSSNEAAFLFQLFARVYGTNNVNNCSYYCHQATSVGLSTTIGTGTATVELDDLAKCDLIFVIGANPSSNHPRFIHALAKCRQRGGEVIVINPAKEPGLVKFALPKSPRSLLKGGDDIASEYLQPRIGEDIALLKGIAKAVLELRGEAEGFISQFCDGFDGFRADLAALDWAEVEARTGINRQRITQVARKYCASKFAVFAWGMGITHHVHGVENVEAIANLALLRAMVGHPGAGLLPLRGHSNVQGIGTIGVKPVLADDVIHQIERKFGVKLPLKTGMDTMSCMHAAFDGEIDSAVLMGGNLYAANPNTDWAAKALNQIGFKLFLTTTLNQGHVNGCDDGEILVLPVAARDEEWEPTTQESMFNFVRLSDGGISRLNGVRPESVILADLASGVLEDALIDFQAFKRHKLTREAIAEIVPGMRELADIDVAKQEFHIQSRVKHAPEFFTISGKACFVTTPMPEHSDAPNTFRLSTLRSEGQFNSIIYEEADKYRGTDTRWCVMMNVKDMARLSLREGDRVDMSSAQGTMQRLVVLEYDLPDGCVLAYYPEANLLTGTHIDPRSKTPAFKNTEVEIKCSV